MAIFKIGLSIESDNGKEAAQIKKMFENMLEKMDRKTLLMAAEKINANPNKKIRKLESGIKFL